MSDSDHSIEHLIPDSTFYREQAERAEQFARTIRFERERTAMLEIAAEFRALELNARKREGLPLA
jgi:hypothetical protein